MIKMILPYLLISKFKSICLMNLKINRIKKTRKLKGIHKIMSFKINSKTKYRCQIQNYMLMSILVNKEWKE
jgi:hypothetical protein